MAFTTQRRIEFRDTDAAGIVHFSVFFTMMETAEHEMLRSLGISVLPDHDDDQVPLSWPRVAASCDYVSAARFEDLLDISVSVAKIGSSSVQYHIEFTRDRQQIATGSMTSVCCHLEPTGLKKSAIPGNIRELLATQQ